MTTKQSPSILITGATGNIGAAIVKILSEAGTSFRAMVRTEKDADTLRALPGAEVVIGDFDNKDSVANALNNIERAFLLTNSTEHTERQQKSFVDTAKEAGVAHIIKQSQWAADKNSPVRFLRYHAAVEDAIKSAGLTYTFLRPNLFMQGLIGFKKTISGQGKFYAAIGDAKVSIVDIRDIAAVAVKALTGSGHEDKIYNITGPEALTHSEMAARLSEGMERSISFVNVSPAAMLESLLGAKFPRWMAEGLIEDYEHYARSEAAIITHDVEEVTGKPATSFTEFVKDYKDAFQS